MQTYIDKLFEFSDKTDEYNFENVILDLTHYYTECKKLGVKFDFSKIRSIIDRMGVDKCLYLAILVKSKINLKIDIDFLNYFKDNGANFSFKYDGINNDYNIGQLIIYTMYWDDPNYIDIILYVIDQSIDVKIFGNIILPTLALTTSHYSELPDNSGEHVKIQKILDQNYNEYDVNFACASAIIENNFYIINKINDIYEIRHDECINIITSDLLYKRGDEYIGKIEDVIKNLICTGFDAKKIIGVKILQSILHEENDFVDSCVVKHMNEINKNNNY